MSVMEEIKQYVDKTGPIPNQKRFDMRLNELFALRAVSDEDWTEAFILAFVYGRAKGYRAAKAER